MDAVLALAEHHRRQAFSLPRAGNAIISAETGMTYVIGKKLGGGGFGTVFHCVDDWDHNLVAKVLMPIGDQQEMESRATSEVLAANIVRSPHIVQVHDAFVFEGAYYIISEMCTWSLHDFMRRRGCKRHFWFPPLVKAVLHALHFMHTRGLAHCDIHSGNVLLHCKHDCIAPGEQSALDFKVGDFGQTRLASVAAPRSTWNENCVPPEVLDESFGPTDFRADLYQAGLLFLRFLTRRKIEFDNDDVLSGAPRKLAEGLSHPAGAAISCMLRRHVEARPDSALQAWHMIKDGLRQN